MNYLKIVSLYNSRYINTLELLDLLNKNKDNLDSEIEVVRYLIDGVDALYKKYYKEKSDVVSNTIMKDNFSGIIKLKKDRLKIDTLKEDEKNYINSLLEYIDRDRYFDNQELYSRVITILTDCPLFLSEVYNLTLDDILELTCGDIVCNTLLNVGEDSFNYIVEELIKEDKREMLWNMAYFYSKLCLQKEHYFLKYNYNYLDIMKYFIKKKDKYYIDEMLKIFINNKDKYNELEQLLNK